jgi:hypothetical protein
MGGIDLVKAGAVCAIVTVVGFVAGIALMASNGVQVLIPETGEDGLDWITDVNDAGDWFVAGAAVVVFAGLVGLVAFLGFYEALREAGPLTVVAPVAGAVGLALVTISHATPIALALQFAPDFADADAAAKATLATEFDTWAQFCLLMNYFGDVLAWGVTAPIFAIAILTTRVVPRWIGWVGLVSAVFAGWLGVFAPLSSLIEGITTIGFFAFFLFLLAFGIALLRRRSPADA